MSDNGKIPSSLEFEDLAPIRIPVRIGERRYVLRQASAGEVILYRNFIVRTHKVNAQDRTASTQGYADSEPYLLSLCLREIRDDKEYPVAVQTIKGWPNPILNKLFETCQQISGMLDDEEPKTAEELTRERDALNEKIDALAAGQQVETREDVVKN